MKNNKVQKTGSSPITAVKWKVLRAIGKTGGLRFGHRIGVIITEDSIRLSLIRQRLHRCRVIAVKHITLKNRETGDWTDRLDYAINSIKEFLQKNDLSRVPVNIGLIGDDIAFRRLKLPPMPKKEIAAAVAWEGEKLFPFSFENCYVHHQIVDRSRRRHAESLDINIIAAQKALVKSVYRRLQTAGLEVGQVNFLPCMMGDTISDFYPDEIRNNSLLLFLDDDYSMALFLHNGHPEFYQRFVTHPQPTSGGAQLANMGEVVAELLSFLDLHSGQSFEHEPDRILLSGKYAHVHDLRSALSAGTGLPCQIVFDEGSEPGELTALTADQKYHSLDIIAAGLAEPTVRPLMPTPLRKTRNRRAFLARAGIATGMTVMVIGNLHLQAYFHQKHLRELLDAKQAAAMAYEKSPGYQAYLSLMTEFNRENARHGLNSHQSHLHLLLKELSRTVPDEITLNGIYLSTESRPYVLRLEGHVRLSGFSPEIILAQYVKTLNISPFFDDVSVTGYSKTIEKNRFDLSFHIQMGARV